MIYVHEDLLEALANEIRCKVAENLVASSTVCCDVSDVPCEIDETIDVSGTPLWMNDGALCACMIPEKALEKPLNDLIHIYVYPLSLSLARDIDQTLVSGIIKELSVSKKVHRFPEPTRETCIRTLIDARQALNENRAPLADRHLLMNTRLETDILKAPDEDDVDVNVSGRVLGFDTWLDYYIPYGMAWQKEAVTLVSRPPVTDAELTIFVIVQDLIGIRVSITPQEFSSGYILMAETRLGVIVPKPEFIATFGETQ